MAMMDPEGSSNLVFGVAPSILNVPKYEDVLDLETPEERISRLANMQSPSERLKDLFINTINFRAHDVSHEARWIRIMAANGALFGMLYGGVLNSQGAHADYQRKHNADVFEGKFRANRHFWDTLILRCASKGLKFGFRTGILMGLTGFISFGSITYRDKLYFPDWIVSFTTLGGLSRLWLGSRAVAVGGLGGFVGGLLGYGVARSIELFSGHQVTYFRRLYHTEWLESRQATLRRNLITSSEEHMKYIDQVIAGER